jgi:HD-GYP domain-containing protein (c-di-GMP phosphodiesterase class II)
MTCHGTSTDEALRELRVRLERANATCAETDQQLLIEATTCLSTTNQQNSRDEFAAVLEFARYCYYTGNSWRALGVLQRGSHLAKQVQDIAWQRTMHTLLGALQADSGDYSGAMQSFAIALDKCELLGQARDYAVVWLAISTVLVNWGMANLALPVLKLTKHFAEQIPDPRMRESVCAMAANNTAFAHLARGEYSAGLRACRQAFRSTPTANAAPVDVLNHAHSLENFIHLLLRVGDLRGAQQQLQTARTLLRHPSLPKRGALSIESSIALFEAYSGDPESGIQRLSHALETARLMRCEIEIPLVRRLIEVFTLCGQEAEATKAKNDLAELVARLAFENALFHYKRHISDSELFAEIEDPPARISSAQLPKRRGPLSPSYYKAMENLAVVAEAHDDPDGEHILRVGELSFLIAKQMGLSVEACAAIRRAAPLHDVGKVGIPAELLSKPGSLTSDERQIIQRHAQLGAELLMSTGDEELRAASEIAHYHHEWWDGTGYPSGLRGTDIPIAARIAAVSDCFDAMSQDRCYRPQLGASRALAIITERSDRQFDPAVVNALQLVLTMCPADGVGEGTPDGKETRRPSTFVLARRRLVSRLRAAG